MTHATPSYTPQTADKIQQARSFSGRAYEDTTVSWPNFAHMFKAQAEKRADETYLIYRDGENREEYTFSRLYARACKIANVMRHHLGLGPNDRVVTAAYNHADTVAVTYAAWLIGAVVVPCNMTETDERITYIINNAATKAVFAMPDLIERLESLKNDFEPIDHFVQINGESQTKGYEHLPALEAAASDDFQDGLDMADQETEALIVYTSGTTGAPKGVLLQQHNILACCQSIAEWQKLTPEHRFMLILPIHHVNGLMVTLVTPRMVGGSTVLNRKFSASQYWDIAAEEGANCASVVPTILSFLCEVGKENYEKAGKSIEFIICGAGPLTVQTVERFEDMFGIEIVHGYGLSETTVYTCYIPRGLNKAEHNKWLRDFGYPSIGRPISCNEMDIQDPEGHSLKEEERGEIVVRGQNVMKCYYKRPEANAESFANGWFRSGDEGFFKTDNEGHKYFFITGRLKELIIRGGVNYSPLEIDEVLNRIPGVKAGLAVGFENNMYGEEIGAYVVLEEGQNVSAEDILAACAKDLAFNKRPKVVVFGNEVPVTSTGKYQRLKLKDLFAEWKDHQFREQKTA